MSDEQTTVDEAVQVAAREQFVLSESFGVMTRDEQWVWRVAWKAGRDYQRQQAGAAVNDELVKALEAAGSDLIGFEGYFERLGSMGTVASIRTTIDKIDDALARARGER